MNGLTLGEIHALNTGKADDALKAKAKKLEEAAKADQTKKVEAGKPSKK